MQLFAICAQLCSLPTHSCLQDEACAQAGPHYSSRTEQLGQTAFAAASAATAAAGQTASASKAAISNAIRGAVAGAATAVQAVQAMPGTVKKASLTGMWTAFSKLLKDAAERHNTAMITPDISGWFFVIGNHGDELRRQQISQLQHLVWFTAEPQLQEVMKPAGLGSNAPGVALPAGPTIEAAKKAAAGGSGSGHADAPAAADSGAAAGADAQPAAPAAGVQRQSKSSSGGSSSSDGGGDVQCGVPGQPFEGLMLHLGGSSSKGKGKQSQQQGLQLHVGAVSMLDDLLAGARYSHAAYGYVAAAGHMSSVSNALKLLATLPLFDPITGVHVRQAI